MKTKLYITILFLMHLCGCKSSSNTESNGNNSVDDEIKIIKHSNLDSYDKPKDFKIHKEDYKVIETLKTIGKNSFFVSFYLSNTHVNRLIIKSIRSGNKVKSLTGYIFNEKTTSKLPGLKELKFDFLDLQGNIYIPKGFKKLKSLKIYGNNDLKNIYFKSQMNLLVLNIPKNGLTSINTSFRHLAQLQKIALFDNNLTNIDLSIIPWVQRVDISDNPISFDRIDSLRLKYPKINIVAYHYKKKRPGNYIDRDLDEPVYE